MPTPIQRNNQEAYDDFLNKLRQECEFHQEEGRESYRYRLAVIALMIAERSARVCTVEDFAACTDRAREAVNGQLEAMESEGPYGEVMETLRVVARYTLVEGRRSEEAAEYVEDLLRRSRKMIVKPFQDK